MPKSAALPPRVLGIGLLAMLVLHFLLPIRRVVRFPANLFGLLPLAAGVLLNLAADALLKRHHTTVKPFQESAALVTSGVFRLSRHPMYLGFVLILLGIGLLLGSLSPFVIVVALPFVLEGFYIRSEERMLSARFGERWLAYTRKVRRWI